ncbi:hypothetical protein O3G_MSEX009432 [Manduca sexta]|uniref:Uncharacterized protein n=1 Tax=Manduca sexta TaxID=7130 RepID=A0A921ZEF5_MANSE|nr:hypothetical protein O3G_MSEX009432 [Manduca sexta]
MVLSSFLCFILLSLHLIECNPSMKMATLQPVPPRVSLAPWNGKHEGSFININPFLTNSLLQALVEESELKKRVQRYRDVA